MSGYDSPFYTQEEIRLAEDLLNSVGNNRIKNNNVAFSKGDGATYSEDFTNMSLKRSCISKSKIFESDFTGASLTGSKFIDTSFRNCTIVGANLQFCDFIKVSFHGAQKQRLKLLTDNFSNSTFMDTKFVNVEFAQSTISQSAFENCEFKNCVIYATTLEGTSFRYCYFENVDMSNLNIEYTEFLACQMNNVTFPIFQMPYIINLFRSINDDENSMIWLDSEKSPDGRISYNQYKQYWPTLNKYFYGLSEYFPMANLYLAMHDTDNAFACILKGIDISINMNNYRMVKHYCRLATAAPTFSVEQIKQILSKVDDDLATKRFNKYEMHGFLENIGDIRNILLNSDYNQQTLEITIQTNIDSSDSESTGDFLANLNDLLDGISGDSRSHYIELRHNSDYSVLLSYVSDLQNLVPILVNLYGALGIAHKIAKFYTTLQDIQINNYTIKKNKEKENVEVESTKVKELEARIYALENENPQLRNRVTSVTHYIKGSQVQRKRKILYEKVEIKPKKSNK